MFIIELFYFFLHIFYRENVVRFSLEIGFVIAWKIWVLKFELVQESMDGPFTWTKINDM